MRSRISIIKTFGGAVGTTGTNRDGHGNRQTVTSDRANRDIGREAMTGEGMQRASPGLRFETSANELNEEF
jgi:hypothetical protein